MKLTHENQAQLTLMEIRGDLTIDHADALRKQALECFEENVCDFVLDVGEMEFVDSVGLETLLWLQEQCAERLGQLRLAGVSENVMTILRLTRLDARLDTHDDTDTAIKSLNH